MENEQRRLTIGILVSGIMDDITRAICKGVRHAVQQADMDVDVVVMPGKYLDRDLSDNWQIRYEYQYNTIFSYARPDTVDGLVVAADCIGCTTTRGRVERLLKTYEGIPCVLVASKIEGYINASFDNAMGIREGMRYLIEQAGYTRFGMIGGSSDNSDAEERKQTFIECLQEHHIAFRDDMFVEGGLSRDCQAKAAELLDRHPDMQAIFCVNDEVAIGLYEELKRRNLRPGQDISVLGYDDSPAAMLTEPPLSSVRADMGELGAEAFRMLIRMLQGQQVESYALPTKCIRRKSFVPVAAKEEERNISYTELDYGSAFDDIFYRYHYEEKPEKRKARRDAFTQLFEGIADVFIQKGCQQEAYQNLLHIWERFLNSGAIGYVDVDNFLEFLKKFYRLINREMSSSEHRIKLQEFYNEIYRKIIRAMNAQFGAVREAENQSIYSMKLFVRDMLQFEKGKDQSYVALLGNLDWLNIRTAYIYAFKEPVMHLYKETFRMPDTLYLKAWLRDGEVASVPFVEQKLALSEIFHNRFMNREEKYQLVLFPLFSNEMLYGLLLCDLSNEMFVNGEFVVNQMGAAIKMITLLRANEEIQQQLEESLSTLHANNIVLDRLSKSDGLTGMLNRRGFYDAARKLISDSRAEGKAAWVVYVDMNNLKIINDRYGHDEGDFALKLIGDVLVSNVQGKGVAGRIGGDEFACVVQYHEGEEDREILQIIYHAFDTFNRQSDKEYNVTVSAGAYLLQTEDTLSLEEALTQADEKLYEVKQLRKKTVAKNEEIV